MGTPFQFGHIAQGFAFTNRTEEKDRLTRNFVSGTNTIIISPRRWGKSSLVNETIKEFKGKDFVFTFIDLSNVRSEEEFFLHYSSEILKSNSQKIDQIAASVKNFLGKFIPKLSFSPDNTQEFSLSFDWDEVRKDPLDILNLPEKIAHSSKKRQVICIDEFQNISSFSDPDHFQKILRSNWQKHQKTSYCLYGSKRHMMMDVFTSSGKPFYQFGDILFLEKISKEDWQSFIQKNFKRTGKKISKKDSGLIAEKVECHPYYVQQLAQQCWFRTAEVCNEEIVLESHDSLTRQLSLIFQNITDSLANTQVNFLKAMIKGENELSSKKVLQQYKLGTSANVNRIKDALMQKDIIDIRENRIDFLDPILKNWLKNYYFK